MRSRRSSLPAFFATGLLLATSAAVSAESVERYASLAFRESPYAGFRGVVPLTAEQASQRNHYRFVRDDAGRLVEISFRLGDALRDPNHSAMRFFHAPVITVEHGPGVEIRRFFDSRGRPTAVAGGIYEEVFTLDDLGYRASLEFRDRQGRPVENHWGVASYRWVTHPDGSVTEHRKSLAGKPVSIRPGFDFGVLRLRYDVRGLLGVMQNMARDGTLLANASGAAQDKIEYDARGAQTAWNVLGTAGEPVVGNGPNVARGIIARDRWGYEAGVRYEDEAGEPMRNAYGWGRGATTYDRFGNWSSRAFFDEHDEPMVVARVGYHRYDFTWDETGLRLLAMEYSDTEGRAVAHAERGYARVEYRWDDRGNRAEVRYLDTDGHLVQRTDNGVAVRRYEYDEHDRLTVERCLDATEAPVLDGAGGWAIARHAYDGDGFRVETTRFDAAGRPVEP